MDIYKFDILIAKKAGKTRMYRELCCGDCDGIKYADKINDLNVSK